MMDTPLVANSIAEAYFYLMATPCDVCGKGPLQGSDAHRIGTGEPAAVTITATCSACRESKKLQFDLPRGLGAADGAEVPVVNDTGKPSRIIDVAQWLTLFRTIVETATEQTDAAEARRLGLEAAQCLEEALKFYDDLDSDLPTGDAFFHDATRRRFRENPEQFARDRLISLRAKLPTTVTMRSRLASGGREGKRRWWRRKR